jgi:hypothetical protein
MLKRAKNLGIYGVVMTFKVSESILGLKKAKNVGKIGGIYDFQSK